MSFKDLTARAAVAMNPKAQEAAKPPAKESKVMADGKEVPTKPKTS
ncbi:hypothetical protein [Lutimaribacter saemankumensis]|uniref:Uncharacterized protein n=1 Tax=Lutimaribacter saemankumensis TaxID=490829 RepID=A0A1G8SBH7_9RHOB|nr:hypothetical protein [Lutimaribacter saemankumensis]SDJ26105.1 hypothetical protein SAMN05421850_1111 [Lutimaribacter saemankumensis]